MIKFIGLKTNEYSHYDDQTLKTRATRMIKFTRLKTNKYNY